MTAIPAPAAQPTAPAPVVPAARSAAPGTRTASSAARTARYTLATTTATIRNLSFIFFTIGLPVLMFLLVNTMINGEGGSAEATKMTMLNMAAYGGITAALNAGALIQLERANGWLRQLMVAGMSPSSFVIGKTVAAMVVGLLVILTVVGVGVLGVGVREAVPALVGAIALQWIMLAPMVLLGLVVGLAVKPSAVNALVSILTILLAVLGGLWFPTLLFPDWLATLSELTPTHWIGALPLSVLSGEALDLQGVWTVLGWTAVLAIACALLLHHGARTASRR